MKCPVCGSEMYRHNEPDDRWTWFCPIHRRMFDLNELKSRFPGVVIFSFGEESVGGGTMPCLIGDKIEYIMTFDLQYLAEWSNNHAMKGMFIKHDDEFDIWRAEIKE